MQQALAPPTWTELFGPELLTPSGKRVPTETHLQGKFVAIYFSASWCGPCKQFTPVLAKFYNECQTKGIQLEVVFVSADSSQPDFQSYYGNMPWVAMPFEKAYARTSLNSRYRVMGIPTLTILSPEAQIVNRNARGALLNDPAGARFPWAGEEEKGLGGGGMMPLIVLAVLFLFYWLMTRNE